MIFYITSFIFIIIAFFFAREDVRTGLIPDKYTNPLIILAVIFNFIVLGFFSFQFYLYFTILVLLYLFFVCIQYAMHYTGRQLGTGDVKMLLFFYALIPFNVNAFAGIPLLNLMFWSIVIIFLMISFKMLYFLLLNKIPVFKIMYGRSVENTHLRLAPLIFFAFIITFILLL